MTTFSKSPVWETKAGAAALGVCCAIACRDMVGGIVKRKGVRDRGYHHCRHNIFFLFFSFRFVPA